MMSSARSPGKGSQKLKAKKFSKGSKTSHGSKIFFGKKMPDLSDSRRTSVVALVSILSLLVTVSSSFAQKKAPPTAKLAAIDSTNIKEKTPEKILPSLDLKEYTILGKDRMRVLPSQRRAIELSDITAREMIAAAKNQSEYQPPGAGGEKTERSFVTPFAGVVNEAYVTFGRYTDVNAGVKLRKQYEKDDYFADFDFHRNSGHISNAGYYNFAAEVSQVHRFTDAIQNRTELSFNFNEYKFYADPVSPHERKSFYAELSSATNFTRWDPVNVRWEVGGRYYDPDSSKIFNWDLWTRLDWNTIAWSTLISGLFEYNTDRIKDRNLDNAPLSDANYAKALITLERLVTNRLHFKIGGAFYHYYTQNAGSSFQIQNNQFIASDLKLITRKKNIFVPIGSLTYDMAEAGRLFVEFEPEVVSFNLLEKLQHNPYTDLTTPHTYENISHNIKIGWRRSYVYDLVFEIFYSDRRVKNFPILLEPELGITRLGNSFLYSYDNTIDINEYRGVVNWSPHPRFNAWSSVSYIDYTVRKSTFANQVPYLPNLTVDFSLRLIPGYGFQFVVDGQYVGERFVSSLAANRLELQDYMLANITISKQWSQNLGSYIYMSNMLNQDYQVWNKYSAPDFTGGGGLRYFW